MSNQNLNIINQVGRVLNPATTYDGDGQDLPMGIGRSGEAYNVDIHGKYYTAGYRANTFIGTTLVAGTIIPISSATAATFALFNPFGSGKNVELISYDMSFLTATAVVGALELTVLTGVGSSVAIPTSVTAIVPLANPIGGPGGVPVAQLYSAATVVASTKIIALGLAFGTTTEQAGPIEAHLDFDGKIILAPGTLVHVTGNVAQTAAALQQFVWSEWLI
jgi:hypothetical protein